MFQKGLSKPTSQNLELLSRVPLTKNFYLAGGTAVALHFGHRLSFDLDFFTGEDFDVDELVRQINQIDKLLVEQTEEDTLLGKINGEKVSFFYYRYPLIEKPHKWSNINIASLSDLAAMKVEAISSRGRKRDFIDLFFINKEIPIERAIEIYDFKYKVLANNLMHVLRSLSYFDDAEEDDMPQMIEKVSWEEVKDFFRSEVKRLSKKFLSLDYDLYLKEQEDLKTLPSVQKAIKKTRK